MNGSDLRTGRRWGRWIAVAALVGCAAWAFWPVQVPGLEPNAPAVSPLANQSPPVLALDLAAFRAPLWFVPPPPPPAPVVAKVDEPKPPPPLKLQLIAITSEGTGEAVIRAAIFYDPDKDELVTVRPGDQLEGRLVEAITSEAVEIKEAQGSRKRSITLADASAPSAEGSRR